MTCIVGLETPKGVIVGGDSAGTDSSFGQRVRADVKVFTKTGGRAEWIFGFTSSYRMGQLIRYAFDPPTVPEEDEDIDKYMVTEFVDALRDCFKEGGYLEKENGVDSGGTFLVGVRGRLYEIEDDFQVARPSTGYEAVGCGGDIAIGALYATPKMAAERRVRTALEAAERNSAGVRGPFTILTGAAP